MDLFTAYWGHIHFTHLILCPAMHVYSRLEVLLDEILWMLTVFPLKYYGQYETVCMFLSDGIVSGFCWVPVSLWFVTFRGLFIMLAERKAGVMWAWGGLWHLQALAVLSAMCAGILSTVWHVPAWSQKMGRTTWRQLTLSVLCKFWNIMFAYCSKYKNSKLREQNIQFDYTV